MSHPKTLPAITAAACCAMLISPVTVADEPCGDLDECRVYIEINASDGDIGFHVLFDAEGWDEATIMDPSSMPLFEEVAANSLQEQTLTENFFESAEPVCETGLREEPDEDVVTLSQFLERFPTGVYEFGLDDGDRSGSTNLTHRIPAAPAEVDFDDGKITWEYGDDLGECTTWPGGFQPAPESAIGGYEVVLEPDDDTLGKFKLTIQVPADVHEIEVPESYLSSLDPDTPIKVEVGAVEERPDGSFGNQTFTEEDGFCARIDQDDCPAGDDDDDDDDADDAPETLQEYLERIGWI